MRSSHYSSSDATKSDVDEVEGNADQVELSGNRWSVKSANDNKAEGDEDTGRKGQTHVYP